MKVKSLIVLLAMASFASAAKPVKEEEPKPSVVQISSDDQTALWAAWVDAANAQLALQSSPVQQNATSSTAKFNELRTSIDKQCAVKGQHLDREGTKFVCKVNPEPKATEAPKKEEDK